METIQIHSQPIQLDQLLKWAGIIDSGGQVKYLLEQQLININGEIISQRRKKVYPNDIVEIKGIGTWRIIME